MSDEGEWRWELSTRAAEAMEALDADTQQRFLDKFDEVVTDEFREPRDFAKPLADMGSWHSLRVGDYRAIVRFDHERRHMQVGTVGHRSSIYDDFP